MNTTHPKQNVTVEKNITDRCVQSYKKFIVEIERAKNKIADEFRETVTAHQNLFQLALQEAEALAWETEYPQLVFASLAVEKGQGIAAEPARRQTLRHPRLIFAEAA
jgi:predicted secreted hydrolase